MLKLLMVKVYKAALTLVLLKVVPGPISPALHLPLTTLCHLDNSFRRLYHEVITLAKSGDSHILTESPLAHAIEQRKPSERPIYRGYIPELDGLRAIGVVLVILNHMWPWEHYSRILFLLLQLPWMLMDGFFVLSGFLITGILLDTRQRPDYYRSFYIRRSLRIFPIYYVVLTIIVVAAAVNGHSGYREMLTHWGSPAWFFVYLGNIPTAITGAWPLAGGGALVPLWSLQIEEQFYFLFPFLVHRLSLKTLTRVLAVLCVCSVLLRIVFYLQNPSNELIQYVLLPCHCEGLAMGAFLAIRFRQGPWLVNKRRLGWTVILGGVATLAFAAFAGFYHTSPINRTVGYLFGSVWFTYVIFTLIQFRGSRPTAFLRTPVFQYLGKVSYGAYLFHWPIANALTTFANHFGAPALDQGLTRLTLIFALTFGFAALSWHLFERPIQKLKDLWFPDAKVPLRTAAA